MAYELVIGGPYAAMVSIFHGDGSVQVGHGGIEIGQGINTKVLNPLCGRTEATRLL